MSQSATLYRISRDTFKRFAKSDNKQQFDIVSISKSYSTFQGSFVGLEYILSKGQDISTTEFINQIFNPKQSLGGQDIESLTPEEQFELHESENFIPYLDTATISNINDLLNKVSKTEIHSKYDAEELNQNEIYPSIWHTDNSPDQIFNERQILEDLAELKTIFKQANDDEDYILVFIG